MTTNKINVTNIVPTSNSPINTASSTVAANWSYGAGNVCEGQYLAYLPNAILWIGNNVTLTANYTRIFRCTDKATYSSWTAIDLPFAAHWQWGAYGNGITIIVGHYWDGAAYSAKIIYSTDEGATWGTGSSQVITIAGKKGLGPPVYNGSKWLVTVVDSVTSATQLYHSTDNALTWSNLSPTGVSLGNLNEHMRLAYNSYIGKWLLTNQGTPTSYISTDSSATTWTSLATTLGTVPGTSGTNRIISTGKYYILGYVRDTTPSYIANFISDDGVNWTKYFSGSAGGALHITTYFAKDLGNGIVLFNNSNVLGAYVGIFTIYTNLSTTNVTSLGDNMGVNNTQCYNDNTNYILHNIVSTQLYKFPINIGSLTASSYVDVTASKAGCTSVTKRLYIVKNNQPAPIYSLLANPGAFTLTATADGVVDPASYPTATGLLTVTKDGVDQTGWTFAKADDTGLVTSITGSTFSVTSLSNSVDRAFSHVYASKTGEPSQLLDIQINKNKTGAFSGIHRGGSLSTFRTNSATTISIKFAASGAFQVKYDTGSYTTVVAWVSPINTISPPGGSWWLMVTTTGETLTSGTTGSWLSLATDREFVLTRTTPSGTYTTDIQAYFGTTSTGGNISLGTCTLQIIVP